MKPVEKQAVGHLVTFEHGNPILRIEISKSLISNSVIINDQHDTFRETLKMPEGGVVLSIKRSGKGLVVLLELILVPKLF